MGSVCRYYILTKHKSQKIMKVLAFAALAAVGIAQNDDIDEKKFNHMFQMVWSQVEPKTSLSNRDIKNLIRNYGCYCLPIGTRANTALMGPPVDAYDKACKDLTRCYKCLDMDYEVNPSEDRFRWGYSTDNEIQCNDGRNSEAQKAHCECDAAFATTLGALWDDSTYNRANWDHRSNDAFSLDKEAVCVGSGGQTDECCGEYPNRSPYNNADVGKMCCDDGNVRDVGSC